MVKLEELSEGAILHNLRMRYEKDLIYVRECRSRTERACSDRSPPAGRARRPTSPPS
jgi:hypothetical protein